MTQVEPRFKVPKKGWAWVHARAAVIRRDVVCQMGPVGCGGGPTVHHKRLRSQGGTNDLDNLVLLCDDHHGYVHANPSWSYERGWLVVAALRNAAEAYET